MVATCPVPLCRHLISHPVVLVQDLHGAALGPGVFPEGWAPIFNNSGRRYGDLPEAPVVYHLGWILLTLVLIVLSSWWIHHISAVDVSSRGDSLCWRALQGCIIRQEI